MTFRLPLSLAQREIWREHALFPASAVHTVSACCRIDGPLDPALLERSLAHLWERHQALRLTPSVAGASTEPVQIEAPRPARFLALHDLSAEDDAESAAERLAEALGRRTIPLAGGPTFRFDLIAVAAERHLWVMSYHHLNMDAWANGILVREAAAVYGALARGESPQLPAAPSFSEAVEGDLRFVGGTRFERNRAYWDAAFRSLPDRLVEALPGILEGRAPAATTLRRIAVAGERMDRLRAVAAARGTTPARLFTAAALILFHVHSGAEEIAFGLPVHNRVGARDKATFGLFSLTAAPRVRVDRQTTVEGLLGRLERATREAIRHARFPLSEVNRGLGLAARRRLQLFDLNLSYERVEYGELPFGAARAAVPRVLLNGVERTPIELFVREYGDAERVEVDLDLSLGAFDETQADRLARQFERVLGWLAEGGEGVISAAPLSSAAERHWLLHGVNRTERDYGPFVPVHRRFAALAAAHPERPALRFEGGGLSYGELDRRANGLARRLLAEGLGREGVVGVALERSVELVVALLAVVKAGGAYLPLDPELPAERLRFMIGDAAAAWVVTRRSLAVRGERTLFVDEIGEGEGPEVEIGPEQLAYVIYTSGSTGRPKGVMNRHRGLENRLLWMQQAFPIGAGDRVLQKTPYTFDVSVWEFFWPLITGACLVVAKPGGHRDPDYLARLIRDEAITTLHFVPSMLRTFIASAGAALGECRALRTVVSSGEALPAGTVEDFYRAAPAEATLQNLYGPTEAAIDVTHWACSATDKEPLPIGHAIANTRLYVLDGALEPVPVGVAGDLWIGGVQLARGYLNRPGLTAETFIADPHSPQPGARMYRTGDRAERREDCALIYLGRSDFQVKLRGFRIELGEIEARLRDHPRIRDAAVALREDRPGDPRLVGYLVTAENVPLADLDRYLREQLPEYMVPTDWVTLPELPLTASGKLDRKTLPAPEAKASHDTARPQSPEEILCCNLFSEILALEDFGVGENFFSFGGHSLLAVQLVARLRAALGVELPANALFAYPTPRALARHLREARRAEACSSAPRPPGTSRPASAAETQLWALQQRAPESVAYNMAGMVEIHGALDGAALARAVAAVQRRHPLLHSRFVEGDDGLRVEPRPDWIVVPPVGLPEVSPTYGAEEAARPFRLDRELPLRARIYQLDDDRWRLLLVFHHIAADADSIAIVGRAVERAYALATAEPALDAAALAERLPPPGADPLSAEERLDFTDGGAEAAALARWVERLHGVVGVSPLSRERAGDGGARVETLSVEPPLRRRLGARARAAGVTPFMLLHTALAVALHRFGGGEEVVIGTPVSQRGDEALGDTVGMLLNTVPLRLAVDPERSLETLLEGARAALSEALADAAVPLGRIIEAREAAGEGEGAAPFQVLLTTHAPHLGELRLGDAEVTARVLPQLQAKMDLALLCADDGTAMEITIEHADGLFPPGGAERFAEAFEQILEALAERPETAVGRVPLFAPGSAARQAEIEGPDVVDSRGAPAGSVVGRFAEIAALHGDRPALEGPDGEVISYRELTARSDALAAGLLAHGVVRGEPVGVHMARGVEQITLFLAVLKAGGAYVPLDPEQPGPRLAEMAEDAGIRLVISDGGHPEWLDESVAVVSLAELPAESGTQLPPSLGADAAYLMFTSGSTGRPKGIRIPHRAVLRLAVEPGFAQFGPGKRVAQIATTAFDAATYEIWCALLNGATCVVIEREAAYEAEALAAAFQRARVHSTFLTVSVFNRAVFAAADAFGGFHEVLFGGEAADVDAVREARRRWPAVRFVNGYGPTETTTFAACHETGEIPADARTIPIGSPIRGTALYVLDPYLEPVPRGVAGELWIGGAGLADGYVGAPSMSAERFVADPFSPAPGARMYRTGDRVRRRAEGTVEYLGRIDRQIKLRGFRIEPGEIEAALRAVCGVEQVAVEARERAGGDRALYAWVVRPAGADPEVVRGWRGELAARLPEWMVPRRIGILESFPLTPNGKLDRDALVLPDEGEMSVAEMRYATETQRALAELWAELMGGGGYRPEEGFFAAGGHSLLGVRLAARIRERFGVALPLRELFARPRLAEMAESIERAGAAGAAIEARAWAGDERPVSPMQARLALMERIDGGSLAYSVPLASLFDGVVEEGPLRGALHDLVERHAALRTAVVVGDRVSGRLLPAEAVTLSLEDHPAMESAEVEALVEERAGELARLRFDLSAEPPLRAYLLRFGGTRSALILVAHHIAVDGHSVAPLLNDLSALYNARIANHPVARQALPVSYADWVAWRYGSPRAERDEAALARALEALKGAPTQLELPTDFPRPAQRSHLGAVVAATVDAELERRLRERARALGVTPFALLTTAYALLLARTAGSDDLLLGIPYDGREAAETEGVVGFFADTAVLRVTLDDDPDAATLIGRVHDRVTAAIADAVPLDRLIETLDPPRDTRYTPLFQAMIAFTDEAQPALAFGDLRGTPKLLHAGTAKFDLQLQVLKQGPGLVCALEYAGDLFTEATARTWIERFLRLLGRLAEGAAGRVSTLPLVSEAERDWLLDGVNDTGRDYGPFIPVHRRFEALAAAVPEWPALRFAGHEIAYGELNQRANTLARRLLRAGVGAEVRVGVALERSMELVTALLAVMKAGGAYVPLDPELPEERLRFMIEDAAAPVVVTHSALLERLPSHGGRTVLVDEAGRGGRRAAAAGDPEVAVDPQGLAYVIYTSGSTGRPKGVMNRHRGLENRLLWMQQAFPIGDGDRVLQKTPYTFDVSVWEFFWPLITGACLVVAKPGGHRDPDYLARLIRDEAITTLHFVPSMLRTFIASAGAALGECRALRTVVSSGEALPAATVADFYRAAPAEATLQNLYGPTEAAIDVTHWACSAAEGEPVPIGQAIANTRLYVLDGALEPVPVGVAGDLWIGGVQLARGYLNRPGLTAETFIADPHSAEPGARMYKTGDRARRRADGALIYLGRSDFQVKLRGFRIEPGEIEALLAAHPQVREAAVVLREDRPGDQRLVGYLVTAENAPPADLGPYLRERLPDYMVPSDWVLLPELPLTVSGKLDRKALPAPEMKAGSASGHPETPEEEICCSLFSEVLALENLGVEENFFAHGGHSLLAVQVAGRLRKALGVELPANVVFSHATPRALARAVRQARRADGAPLTRRPAGAELLPAPGQDQLWFLSRVEGSESYNVPDGFLIDGPLDLDALAAAFADLTARHEVLRGRMPEEDGRPVVRLTAEAAPELLVEGLPSADEAGIRAWFHGHARYRFDLERELPLRVALGELPDGRHLLSLVMHHSVTDGASAPVLYRDLTAAYHARRRGRPFAPPPHAIEYYDWALWQRARLDGEESAKALAAVAERLRGAPEQLELPEELVREDARAFSGSILRLPIPARLADGLRRRARERQATLFMLLLAGLGVTLERLSGQDDVVVGTPASGRDREETRELVGYFVNTVPLRLRLAEATTLDDALEVARREVLEGFTWQELPLDRVVHALNLDRSARTPLFRVMMVLQPADRMALELEGAAVTPVHSDAVSARYDLTFAFDDFGGRLDLVLHYADDLFSEAGARRIGRGYTRVLEALAERPEQPLAGLALLAPGSAEWRAEVAGPEAVDARAAPEGTVVSRFAEMAALHGDRPALEGPDGEVMSYRELDARSDALAAGLSARGVGRGEPVGIHMARGVEQIALFLAVLKAGGAYVPLDPEQPGPRLAEMAEDAEIRLVISDGGHPDWLGESVAVVSCGELPAESKPFRPPSLLGADAAYLMFTSGSTGRPKGIRIPQRAVLRLALEPTFAEFAPGKRIAQIATTAFDAATYEIWCALLNGATCVVIEREASYQPEALAAAFVRAEVHSTFLTSALFNRLVFAGADAFGGLEEVLFGGEAADVTAVREARRRWPALRLVNAYGPTETTTFASFFPVDAVAEGARRVPIGGPIRATALYVLDPWLEPLPRGVAGELWIGGAGLADGYLGRPGLTAESFVADPFSNVPGARMYRTGDRVRRRADGAVEYLGRVDRQIKLRGFRIEPGEIEVALREVSGAEQVAVELRERGGGDGAADRALYAWVVASADDQAPRRWRASLAERLPEWMVPRRIFLLDALPLNANGKLDRNALVLADEGEMERSEVSYASETERTLAGLWGELLGGGGYRPEEGFFAAGGHSLLGVKLVALIRERLGVELPLRAVFDHPALRAMAAAVEAARGDAPSGGGGPIQRRSRRSRPS
ncbi:non-ribosomal peptide synthetase [Endothiovibrio diazotrophicus]